MLARRPAQFSGRKYRGPPRAWPGAPQVLRGSIQGEYPKRSLRSIPSSMRKYTGHPKCSVGVPQVLRGRRCPGVPQVLCQGHPEF